MSCLVVNIAKKIQEDFELSIVSQLKDETTFELKEDIDLEKVKNSLLEMDQIYNWVILKNVLHIEFYKLKQYIFKNENIHVKDYGNKKYKLLSGFVIDRRKLSESLRLN